MSRKEEDSGRRPLLFTFVGNNRQMLQEIRDNLSHLRKTEGDDKSGGSLQAKPELSQSTPNLVDKSAKMTRCRLDYHQRALAEIAESLRPFQTVNSDTSSTSSANSTVNGDSDTKQGLSNPGYDEESLMKLVYNPNLEPTIENINKLKKHIEGRNGNSKITAGLGQYPKVIRKQSFESKYGPSSPAASDTNSVRSDSPGIGNVHQRHLLIENLKPMANGHQTPPPLPPRAPIVPPQTPPRGQTPPPNSQGEIIPVSYPGQMGQGLVTSQPQPAVIQPGHVQHMIKVMSPLQVQRENAANQQALYRTHFIQQQQQQQSQAQSQMQITNGANQIVSQGISPVTSLSRQVYGHNGHNSALMHQIPRGTTLTHNGTTNTVSQTSGLPPRVTINLPHPKSQVSQGPSRGTQTVVRIHGQNHHEHSHLIPSQVAIDHDVTRNLNLMTNQMEQMNIQMTNVPAPTSVRAMGATNPPIIMHSVKSKEVQKPVPQQATVPTLPPSNNHATTSNQNYISSVQAQVNGNNAQNIPVLQQQANNNNLRKLQIQLKGQNGLNMLTPEQLQALASQQAQIKIHIQNPTSHNPQNHIQSVQVQNIQQNFPPNYDFYIPRSWPDTPGSTPRSDSPVSRATNQSPLSVLSTTSSPSTNSDIPDKPPPPYPGRSYTAYGHIQNQGQPPVPPRVPLKPQGTTHTPPPPQYPSYPHPHHMVTVPPGQLPTTKLPQSIPYTNAQPSMNVQSGVTSSQWTENNSERPPPLPPPLQNRQVQPQSNQPQPYQLQSQTSQPKGKQNNKNNNNEQYSTEIGDDTDTDTVSSDTSAPEQTHRCMSPMPERRPEARERDKLRRDTKVRNYSPQAFKFYMEQHVENVLKSHDQRQHRRFQLENEMTKVGLSDEAATQMRRMLHQKESNYIRLKRAKMDKLMFDKIITLGVGAFGEVSLVRKRDPKTLYAMKTLRKSDVIKRNQVAHVKAERDILAEADNEWVVKLYYSFQDRDHLYFVMDYVPGGDLMGLLIKMEILDENLARFYIAELVLAIESVHKMGFIHRDIKPDNILIDHDGHIKLTDFGLCTGFRWTHNSKYYQKDGSHARQDSMEVSSCNLDEHCRCEILKPLERRRNRERQRCLAHSLVGTPNYIAPEVLLRQGYSSVCDWWSVGVILYEMLLGHPPFYASTPIETQTKVIHWKQTLKIPSDTNLSHESKDLILKLLCSAEDRLGVSGAQQVKNHAFFSSIHLDGLRKQAAPFIPTIRYPTDTSNFDPVDPEKLRNNDSEETWKRPDSKLENGKHPEHAFYEFTFRRFFDDGGHPCPLPDPNSPVYV